MHDLSHVRDTWDCTVVAQDSRGQQRAKVNLGEAEVVEG